MNLERYIVQLTNHAQVIHNLARGVSADDATWKRTPETWSIVEVVNHLYDEEREDFRAHLQTVLAGPDAPWTPIDPRGWVIQRGYNQRDLAHSTAGFLAERSQSLEWLRGLGSVDWQAAHSTPWGQITAGDLLASWAAHDLLHMRQLVELRWAVLVRSVAPYRVEYAGEW